MVTTCRGDVLVGDRAALRALWAVEARERVEPVGLRGGKGLPARPPMGEVGGEGVPRKSMRPGGTRGSAGWLGGLLALVWGEGSFMSSAKERGLGEWLGGRVGEPGMARVKVGEGGGEGRAELGRRRAGPEARWGSKVPE